MKIPMVYCENIFWRKQI